jgi:hypothetical protein
MDAEVVETVAGVVRLLRREAELVSHSGLGDAVMILTLRWYTVAQVAQLLNYAESKVRMLIITGQLR